MVGDTGLGIVPVHSLRRNIEYAALAVAFIAVLSAESRAQSVQVQSLLDQGDRAFARADYEDAGRLYDRAIVAEPRTVDPSYYAKRADIFVFRKEYAQGLRWIASTAELHKPGDPLILAKKALLLQSSGRHAQAIALAERVVERAPGDYALQLLVGAHHFARGAKGADRAIAAYNAFLANRPAQLSRGDIGIRLRLGYAYLYKGDFARAQTQLASVTRMNAARDKNPSVARLARGGLCAALTGLERWPQAATACQRAIAQAPVGKSGDALHYDLARAYLRLEQPTRALAEANKYLQLRPGALRGHLLRGDIHADSGDWQRAEAEYREAARITPGHPDPVLRLGRLHLRQARPRPDLAVAELKIAHEAYPDAKDIVSDLAGAHLANHQFAEARALARANLQRSQGRARAALFVIVGDSYYTEGESLDEAANAYGSALAADPGLASARAGLVNSLNRVAMAALEKNDFDGAQTALEQAIETEPKTAMSQFNLGLVLVERGKPRAALKPLNAAHELAPGEARVEHVLAHALARTGDAASATEHLRSARATALRAGLKSLAAESSVEIGRAHV